MHVHMCIYGPEVNISVFLYCCPPSFLRQRLTTLVLEGNPVFGSHLPKPSTAMTHEQNHYFQDLNGGRGGDLHIWTQVLILAWQHFVNSVSKYNARRQ